MKRLYDLAAVDKKVELGLADKKSGSLRIWMENAPHLHGWDAPPNSCEEAWRKCAHMGEDFRERRIQTATDISGEYVHSLRGCGRHHR
jgi:hypothetical protein